MKRYWIFAAAALAVVLLGVAVWWFFFRKDLSNQIVLPYIGHQKPLVDPHIPHSVPLSDKLDEVVFDGLFNRSANPSGVVYEDGLGELIDISTENVITVRLKPAEKWHSSFQVRMDGDKVAGVDELTPVLFTAQDLNFTLRRIQRLGSLSQDYIIVSQALSSFDFEGPDNNGEIRFRFKSDRQWTEDDIKEVLSFKILPHTAEIAGRDYREGTGPYLAVSPAAEVTNYFASPARQARLENVILKPYVDNSTFTTELRNGNFNVLLETPFGSISPILGDQEEFFYKSRISSTLFAVLFNTQRLNLDQRIELRKLINNRLLLNRFFKVGTEQQRHISDYKGNQDNYEDYLNHSVFPSSSHYVADSVVFPIMVEGAPNVSILPDSIRLVASLNHGNREEYRELVEIFNDPTLFGGKIRAFDVQDEDIKQGNYDAILIAVDGYMSNFFFDFYSLFLREPDLAVHQINLKTTTNSKGEVVPSPQSLRANGNFNRLDATQPGPDQQKLVEFLEAMHGFMYTNHIGDRYYYAEQLNQLEYDLALGRWLFSLPSLAYFRSQFNDRSIDLYGEATQLSTIEKWEERRDD